jgi:hypothetical protein
MESKIKKKVALSPAKLAAKRANALKSTGPRTTGGQRRSAANARVTHGSPTHERSIGFTTANPNPAAPSIGFATANPNREAPSIGFATANPNAAAPSIGFTTANPNREAPSIGFATANPNAAAPSIGFATANPNRAARTIGFTTANPNPAARSIRFATANPNVRCGIFPFEQPRCAAHADVGSIPGRTRSKSLLIECHSIKRHASRQYARYCGQMQKPGN